MPQHTAMMQLSYTGGMALLEALALAFINTFGITQPTDAQRRRAAWFIAVMLALTIVAVGGVGYGFFWAMHR